MRISSVQPVSVILPAASQKKSGDWSSPRDVAGHRVVLDAARVGEEHLGGLAVVAAVDDDAAVIGRAGHRVVVAERRPDEPRGFGSSNSKPA